MNKLLFFPRFYWSIFLSLLSPRKWTAISNTTGRARFVDACSVCRHACGALSEPGYLPDSDSRFLNGIPICTACGGLGNVADDIDFQKRVKQIAAYRFEYCPFPGKASREVQQKSIRNLRQEVRQLLDRFPDAIEPGCFAQQFLADSTHWDQRILEANHA